MNIKKLSIWSVLLILVLIFSFILRLIYFNDNTAIWWDSADYLTGAKEIAGKFDLEHYELSPRRPFFLSVFWGALIFLGANDTMLHFSVLIFSMIAVWMTYLIGKDLYSKKAGLISAFMLAVFWPHLFHTARLLTDVIASTFWLIALYFFIKGYIKEEKQLKNLILFGLFFGLSWFTRSAIIIMIGPLLLTIILKDKLNFVKNKNLWLALLAIFIAISPFIIYLATQFDNPLQAYTGIGQGRFEGGGFKGLYDNTKLIITSMMLPFVIIFLIGLFYALEFLFGLDFLVKKENSSIRNNFFLFIIFITPLAFLGLTFNRALEERYFFSVFPIAFIIGAQGLTRLNDYLKKYYKHLGLVVIIGLLLWGAIAHISTADIIIDARSQGFAEIKFAGEWIKENSDADAVVMSASKFQNMYYSERDTIPICDTEECRQNQNLFIERLRETNPDFVVFSIYEQGFTPNYLFFINGYIFAQDNPSLLKPLYWYPKEIDNQNPPKIVVYKYLG